MKSPIRQFWNVFLLVAALLFLNNLFLCVAVKVKLTNFEGLRQSSTIIKTQISQRVGVVISEKTLNLTRVQRSFERFLDLFEINLNNTRVDFLTQGGLSGFLKQLEGSKYTTVVKAFDTKGSTLKDAAGYCHLSQGLSKDFNKTILLWPCPSMKASSNYFLPSFEATSFAVKSVAKKLNWTEVVILVPDFGNIAIVVPTQDSTTSGQCTTNEFSFHDIGEPEEYTVQELAEEALSSKLSLFQELREWALLHKVTLSCVNDLLKVLRAHGFNELPKDARTLLSTPSTCEITEMGAGKFWYNGISTCLQSSLHDIKEDMSISLIVNVDGMSPFHSSILQLWPILFKIGNMPHIQPMVAAIYYGQGKPPLHSYLIDFVQELNEIIKDGVYINGQKITIGRICFVCDTQARSFIKGTPGSNAENGSCIKCTVIGEWDKKGRHMSYPRTHCSRRTDQTFRHKLDEDHHKEDTPLTKLPIDMIASFIVADSLHLFDLDTNWGLPLAIAANLQIPYRLEIGTSHLEKLRFSDKIGKAIIVTSPINDFTLSQFLIHVEHLNYTKILFIDIAAAAFYVKGHFYKTIANIDPTSKLITNLLILTVLSDKFRYFLNTAFQDKGMELVKNFRQTRPWAQLQDTSDMIASVERLQTQYRCQNFNFSSNIIQWCYKAESSIQSCYIPTEAQAKEFRTIIRKICTSNDISRDYNYNFINSLESDNFLNEFFHLFDFIVSNLLLPESTVGDSPKYDFLVLDVQRNSSGSSSYYTWRPFLILEQSEINLKLYTSHPILPGYNDWLLDGTANLWHCRTICWTVIAFATIILFCIVGASVSAGVIVRNYLLRKRLSKGPNKIVLSANDFVFPVDARRVDEGIEAMLCCWLQQLQEFGGPEVDKPDLLKGSIGSLKNLGLAAVGKTNSGSGSLARHNTSNFLDMRARYNGDLVQLKEIPLNGSLELKSKAMDLLVMMHGLRHENLNPLIGWLSDPNRTAVVFDYCSRGSLQDVLIMDEIKLDWSFRLSLLTDLVRGMRYLHSTPVRVHGALSSRNCVVDARWVLKITDYGLSTFYESQGLCSPSKNSKELLWTAPEILRNSKGQYKCGTQLGDVYSFGIIMQEVVVRGEPYCMLSLSPEEIITKIKKPPPLIRPSVSKGAAPPEAINIMRQCWAEMPDMRPDFNSVYERFKLLNHGRKVNFVDTMFQMLEKYSNNLEELIRERTEQLDIERKKTEQLLNRMLPSSVAEKLKMGLAVDPEEFSDVTIYFSDIVGFTTIAAHCSPVQVVDLLNDLYTIFDATINAYNVYKVETIGDAYMVVSGLPVRIPDHAEQIATMALDLLHQSGRFKVKHLPGVPLQLRIGLHTGPCCAGVVGLTMPRYCLFGDTVNTASRMESTGSSWRIHMSYVTRERLENAGGYHIESRGPIEIKGKGKMNTYWLLGKKGFDKLLPNPPAIGEAHGLDESLIRNSIILKAASNKSRNCSTNPSSSQSSSFAGESVEVKVEITPPSNVEPSSVLPNSYSLDSSSSNLSPSLNLITEFPIKTPGASPQQRKLSELSPEGLLNPANFNRLNPSSTGGSSSRLYKKIEEMIDLSSPYNHYKCLSPSENNLSQFSDGKYLYGINKLDNKPPGSTRLLRRQFSLDKDDGSQQQQIIGQVQQNKQTLDIPVLQETRCSPKCQLPRLHKQNSSSIAQDLEKIEEIPLSPASSLHHSSLESSLNRSPPIGTSSGSGLGNSPRQANNVRSQEIKLNVEALMFR